MVCMVWYCIVRFPNPLAIGSGLGFQCPKKWELFLWGLLAQPFGDAQGWVVAYWVRTDLRSLWHQHWSSTFTQCCCSRAFMSSAQSSLRPPPNPHFVFSGFSTCISHFHLHDISNVHKLMDEEQFRDPNQTKPCCAHAANSCGMGLEFEKRILRLIYGRSLYQIIPSPIFCSSSFKTDNPWQRLTSLNHILVLCSPIPAQTLCIEVRDIPSAGR